MQRSCASSDVRSPQPGGYLRVGLLLLSCVVARGAGAQSLTRSERDVLSPFAAEKARMLMGSRLPCLGCHQWKGEGGGRVGPDLSSAVERRSPDYIARIVDEPQTVLPGSAMPRTPMMPELRALVLAALIGTTPGKVPPRQPPLGTAPASAAPTPNAAGLYARYCAACHGRDGGGDGPNARYLPVRPAVHRDATLMSTRTDDRLFDAIYAGGYPLGKNGAMPGFGATLSRADIWSLVRYLRLLCHCAAPAWSTDGARGGRPTGMR